MDTIVSYGSEDEQESEIGDKYRDLNSAQTEVNRHVITNNQTSIKDRYIKEKHEPDHKHKEKTGYSKKDVRDRDRDQTRPRSSKGEDRSYERRRDDRERDDRRERHNYRYRDYKSRSDKKYWDRSSSRNRHRESSSPCDKRDKERRRYITRTNSQERNALNKNTASSDNTSVASKFREHDRLTNNKDIHYLNATVSKEANIISTSTTITNTAIAVTENKSETSAPLPSYYNPNVINPNKYAEQVQKRKLLWSNKKSEDTTSKWGSAQFAQDTDGKVASKFMRLMGIKDVPKVEETKATITGICSESIKKREEMFSSMEQQYEVARQATHTMRGVGLGFSSQTRPF